MYYRLTIFFTLVINSVYAQTDCSKFDYQEAVLRFEAGQFEEMRIFANPDCVEQKIGGINERVEMYRMLIIAALFNKEDSTAKQLYRRIQKTIPNYTPPENDPYPEFYRFADAIQRKPLFSFSLAEKTNASIISSLALYDLYATEYYTVKTRIGIGYEMEGLLSYHISRKWTLTTGLGYGRQRFDIDYILSESDSLDNDILAQKLSIYQVSVPLYISCVVKEQKYEIDEKTKLLANKWYLIAGGMWGFYDGWTSNEVDFPANKLKTYFCLSAGVGYQAVLRRGSLFAQAMYMQPTSYHPYLVKPNQQFAENTELLTAIFQQGIAPFNATTHFITLSLGINFPLQPQ